ncbi:PREDICTED: lysine-specific demethylase JMJ706-like isoform X1 [Lupinus angustifolius]|uniref:lysine-specific demethylase JMJ706-like isoform X1 n=1 Tax=Lupinus angustifolius TaxID=3871 RepID=UPI00092E8128|nr:PREDICTED: lysine-specific demethylase JMJ706-like isoform X1 [Lupinus angustifolius]
MGFSSSGRKRKTNARNSISYKVGDVEWTNNIPECPVYYPSEKEFQDSFAYLHKIVPEASTFGICKIVSPIIASIPASVVLTKEKKDFKFETNVQPLRLSEWNEKDKITFMKGRKYTYKEFEALANKAFLSRFYSSRNLSSSYIEKEFWREMAHGRKGTVEYGVNVEGSAFSCDPNDKLGRSKWNLKNFSRLPQSTLRLVDKGIPGITDPMLYIGMLFSMFAWHVEDHYLYSINYHHSGANKIWYGIPAHEASQFEDIVLHNVYCKNILSKYREDKAFQLLAYKTTMFPPNIFLQHDVPVYKAVQKPGEFVITFPRAYHAGFSHGFNCGEAVNFAIGDWFPLGAEASKRYANLRMFPIIPYEELLCKEAMQLYKLSKDRGSKNLACNHATVLSFVHLMQFYKKTLLQLKGSKECSISSRTIDTLICCNCHRDCYVCYMLCEHCYSHPICLYHDIASKRCTCGREYTVFKREDMLAMEDAATKFEEKGRTLQLSGFEPRCLHFMSRNFINRVDS